MGENAGVPVPEQLVQGMREHVILKLMGLRPIWMSPAMIPAEVDAELSWPDLFEGLPERSRRAVREAYAGALASTRQAGDPPPSRAEVAELAADVRAWEAGDRPWPSRANRRRPH